MSQLIFLKNGEPVLKRELDRERIVIGRDPSCDIQLLEPEISRQHCRIERQNGFFVLKDSSRNGTFMNEKRIAVAPLKPEDTIQIGPWLLKIVAEGPSPLEETLVKEKTKSKGEESLGSMLGVSKPMKEVFQLVRTAAASEVTVCLIGESGTGKELAAHSLHSLSARRERPLVAVNCGAIPENLIESILFGHERGSFTGATERHSGVFEEANGGTLFLDEIGEMPLDLQTRLLRVLETKTVRRVGGKTDISVDIRLVAATNRDLKQLVARGVFRQDLFYRLYIFPIYLAPLKERPEDIELLAKYFVTLLSPSNKKPELSAEAIEKLKSHVWQGNVRELKNTIQRTLLLFDTPVLGPTDIELNGTIDQPPEIGELKLGEQEKYSIIEVLRKTNGNYSKAARHLGIARTTLASKLRRYKISLV